MERRRIMINNTLPPAPIEDKDCRLTFCVDGIVYAVNTLSEEEREECKAKLNKHSGRTFEWVVEHGGERHWVLYDTTMYHKEHSTLTYIDSCTLAPTIPINATSCYEMFRGCEYVNLSAFNTENIIEMSYMFEHYKGETLDVSKFHTAKTVNMYGMFADCHNLQRLDVGNFNTENVVGMGEMFYNCQSLEFLNLESFCTEKVTDMSYMFWNCRQLVFVNLKSFNTAEVTQMNSMFENCCKLCTLNLTSFQTGKVQNIARLFYNSHQLREVLVSEIWNLDYLANKELCDEMFFHCDNLLPEHQMFYVWMTEKMTDFGRLTLGDSGYESPLIRQLFRESSGTPIQNSLGILRFSMGWHEYKVDTNSEESREECRKSVNRFSGKKYDWVKEKSGKKHWVFYNTEMFEIWRHELHYKEECGLDPIMPYNSTSCAHMFESCTKLEKLDFSKFHTDHIVNMYAMFHRCYNIKELDLSHFRTDNVITMARMFDDMRRLEKLNLSHFNTENVSSMSNLFKYCFNLKELDLRNFDTSNVRRAAYLFGDCRKLTRIYVSPKWVVGANIRNKIIFERCRSLANYDDEKVGPEMLTDISDGGYLTVLAEEKKEREKLYFGFKPVYGQEIE